MTERAQHVMFGVALGLIVVAVGWGPDAAGWVAGIVIAPMLLTIALWKQPSSATPRRSPRTRWIMLVAAAILMSVLAAAALWAIRVQPGSDRGSGVDGAHAYGTMYAIGGEGPVR